MIGSVGVVLWCRWNSWWWGAKHGGVGTRMHYGGGIRLWRCTAVSEWLCPFL